MVGHWEETGNEPPNSSRGSWKNLRSYHDSIRKYIKVRKKGRKEREKEGRKEERKEGREEGEGGIVVNTCIASAKL
jgi:hypothetical protein